MLKVLIVDDEEIICNLISSLVDWEKYHMQLLGCVYDGEEAFEEICEKHPDVVITDIRMPGMDGLEMIRGAREANISVYFLILSGYKDFSYAQEAIRLGASAYLLKPVDEDELLHTLLKIQAEHEVVAEQSKEQEVLSQQLEDSRQKVWSAFLLDLLEARELEKYGLKDITEEELNRVYAIELKKEFYRVVMLKWDNPYGNITEEESKYLTSKCVDYFCTCLPEALIWYTAQTKEGMLVILNGSEEETGTRVVEAFRKTKSHASAFSEGMVSAGISQMNRQLLSLPELVKQAEKACCLRIFQGCGKMLEYQESSFKGFKSEELMSLKNAKELQQCLELMDWERGTEFTRGLFKQIPEGVDPDICYQLHRWILTEFLQGMSYLGAEFENAQGIIDIMCQEIRCSSSIDQIIRGTNHQIKGILKSCKEQSFLKENRLTNIAKEYIRKNYNKDIRLAEVAEQVYLSPTYFSTIFKRETGMNFNEFLTEYRLERAKELLKNLEYHVNEVGAQVGYEDAKYFSKLFRKIVGISPRDFRKLYMRDKI